MAKAKATAKSKPIAKAKAKAKATAKPKAKKKMSVAESWAEGYRALTDACRERWSFLVRDHGFADAKIAIQPPSCMVTFARDGDWVRTASEYAGKPWVVIKAGEGEPFGLDVIIAELDPAYAESKPVPARDVLTDEEMRAVVAYQAAFVERHAKAILSGDPALLARFKEREHALRAAAS